MNRRFPRSLLSLSILSALVLPSLALAQDATSGTAADASAQPAQTTSSQEATDLDTVTVTALRQSLETAQSLKQDAAMVVDSIVAEDIGKLPDNSVADALQRVTGVQIAQGNQGETTSVVIRGLPNVITTLNGREIFSSSGRGFAFQNLPATAVRTLSVYKTSEASLPLGGIAGLVDIQLRRPFDFDGREVAGTYTATHSKYGGSVDPNASLMFSDRWDTDAGEFGALVNFGYQAKDYAYDAVWGDFPKVVTNGTGEPIRTSDGNLIAAPNGWGTSYNDGYRERGAFNYALQWKPREDTEIYLEGLYDWVRDSYANAFYFTFPVGAVTPSQLGVTNHCYPNQLDGALSGQTICDASNGVWTGDTYAATSTQAHKQRGQDIQNALGLKWDGDQLHLSTEFSRTSGYYRDENFIIDTFLSGPITTVWEGTSGRHQNWYLQGDPALDPSRFYLNGLFQTWGYSYGEENSVARRRPLRFRRRSDRLAAVRPALRRTQCRSQGQRRDLHAAAGRRRHRQHHRQPESGQPGHRAPARPGLLLQQARQRRPAPEVADAVLRHAHRQRRLPAPAVRPGSGPGRGEPRPLLRHRRRQARRVCAGEVRHGDVRAARRRPGRRAGGARGARPQRVLLRCVHRGVQPDLAQHQGHQHAAQRQHEPALQR